MYLLLAAYACVTTFNVAQAHGPGFLFNHVSPMHFGPGPMMGPVFMMHGHMAGPPPFVHAGPFFPPPHKFFHHGTTFVEQPLIVSPEFHHHMMKKQHNIAKYAKRTKLYGQSGKSMVHKMLQRKLTNQNGQMDKRRGVPSSLNSNSKPKASNPFRKNTDYRKQQQKSPQVTDSNGFGGKLSGNTIDLTSVGRLGNFIVRETKAYKPKRTMVKNPRTMRNLNIDLTEIRI